MVRVIAGTAGGLKLKTLESDATRPTLDRVKEAEFSMIRDYLYGSVVLDLFAGNGGLGIEALSRGAKACYFNDKNKQCRNLIRANLTYTNLSDKSEVSCYDYTEALSYYKKSGIVFDLILLDPPYGKAFETDALKQITTAKLASAGAIAVCEHNAAEALPAAIGHFSAIKEKKYGTVAITVYRNEV